MYIRCEKCTRRNCPELTYCPVVKDQWDCVLNDLEEFGDKEFLVLTSQYNIEIFSCCLRLLPVYSSTFHQTNVENSEFRSEDNLAISRIQSLHLLLEVMTMTKSRQSFCHWASEIPLSSWLNISPNSFTKQAEVCRRGFVLVFDRLAKASTFVFNAHSSDFVSDVSCSLSSYSLSIKSVTNLFNP